MLDKTSQRHRFNFRPFPITVAIT